MIRLFGEIALYLSLFCAFMQCVPPLIGHYRQKPWLTAFTRPAALGQIVTLAIAYTLLTIAFGINDFSITYVAANSHPSLPLMYRLTAVWGAHEGSILLWIMMLSIWTLIFILSNRLSELTRLTLNVLGAISFCFLCFLIFTSNPFLPAPALLAGNDLNPLLQDPGFVIHPPMLYAGYVGFSVAFALTIAGLLQHRLDTVWAIITQRFAIAAWCFLTFGITLGSWWAYRVLGWGGFWFWDPVENASLLPWLAGTALIHMLVLVKKRDRGQDWTALIAIVTFALSLLGTFLVRSGVLVSAHTFANDPKRGLFLLIVLGIVLIVALLIYLLALPLQKNPVTALSWFSRESMLYTNSGLLMLSMATILLGTLYPLILDAFHLDAVSIGAPYYNTVMLPIVYLTLIAMWIAPLCSWQFQSIKDVFKKALPKLGISFIISIVLLRSLTGYFPLIPIISLSLSLAVVSSVLRVAKFLPGMAIAHLGFAVCIIGILLSSLLSVERDVRMKPGDIANVGPYQFLFITTSGIQGANYRAIQAAFEVMKEDRHIVNLYPEKRIYLVRDMVMTKVDIHPGLFRDLYLALGEPLENNNWTIRIYYKPFMRWIWAGGILMILGGLATFIQRTRIVTEPR